VDIRADIYSLGATFHYLLCGKPPFDEGSLGPETDLAQIKEPRAICELRTDVPAELGVVIAKMMAKDVDKRFAFPSEVIEALAPWTNLPFTMPKIPVLTKLSPAARRSGMQTAGSCSPGGHPGIREFSSVGVPSRVNASHSPPLRSNPRLRSAPRIRSS